MKERSKKIIKNILLIIIITLVALFTKTSTSIAANWKGNANGGMPTFGQLNPTTGMFPQVLFPGKTVTVSPSRNDPNATSWTASYSSGMVYCADMGKILRNGKFDPTIYYIDQGTTYNTYVEDLKTSINSMASFEGNITKPAYIKLESLDKNFRKDKLIATVDKDGFIVEPQKEMLAEQIGKINATLAGEVKPTEYSPDIDSEVVVYGEWQENRAGIGPQVCIMETIDGAGDGYKAQETKTYTNNAEAYVLTAFDNAYGYGIKYTEEDIQTAYWKLVDPDGKDNLKESKLTPNGEELYNKALEYVQFLQNIQNGYKASVDNTGAQVIVNRDKKEYIVGPFKVYYPEYTDLSYIKSISITTDTGKTLSVDGSKQDFEFILATGGTIGSNGNTKKYPKSGEGFFIKFSAEKANYPTNINLNVGFEYLNNTTMKYTELRSKANIYRYIGHMNTSGDGTSMFKGTVTIEAEYTYIVNEMQYRYEEIWGHDESKHREYKDNVNFKCCDGGIEVWSHHPYCDLQGSSAKNCSRCGGYISGHDHKNVSHVVGYNENPQLCSCGGKITGYKKVPIGYGPVQKTGVKSTTVTVYQPYVKMGDKPESTDTAQPLTATGDGSREYKVVNASNQISLTMKLGGTVWEENNGGKESLPNGVFDKDEKPMSGVVVNIYREDGEHIGTTTTNAEGNYIFEGLNAMYQYYVKFTYNGQYYEPTTYSGTDTWGVVDSDKKINWNTNSNGTDKRQDRISYNAKFKAIGSSPINYETTAEYADWLVKGKDGKVYNKAYSRNNLLGLTLNTNGEYVQTDLAVINEFGNLYADGTKVKNTEGEFVLIEEIESKEVRDKLNSMVQFVKDSFMDSYTYKPENMEDPENTNGTMDLYPVDSVFVIDNKPVTNRSLLGLNIKVLYDTALHINQGYAIREEADLAVKKDIDNVTLEINGQKHTYTYDTLENKENTDKQWDISVRISDAYYNTKYSREIYPSDYLYKASDYGTDFAKYGKDKSDELEVYVTYKVMVRNQSMSMDVKVNELVDYYDKDYEYVDNRSYIQIKSGENEGTYEAKASKDSRYETILPSTKTTLDGYDSLYITGLDDKYLSAGQTAYVYLTFRVKKDNVENEDWVKLDENIQTAEAIGVGKENIVEINGYSTKYAEGTKIPNVGIVGNTGVEEIDNSGLIDKDSNPGNLNKEDVPKDGAIKYENFEDDTDKAPNIRIVLNRDDNSTRIISGTVWEDERDESIGVTTTGDGIRGNKENPINGVTVQLVELMENGEEFVWRTFENGSGTANTTTPIINKFNIIPNYNFGDKHDGQYAFKSFAPGKYVVRFIYGDTEKTVLTKDVNASVNNVLGKVGLNNKSYNGQDYKSTTYQEGITQNKVYDWREASTWTNGQEVLGKILTQISTFKPDASNNETATYLYDITESEKITNVSDAKDIESIRNKVNNYSNNNVINHVAEVLASYRELPKYPDGSYNKTQVQSLIDELMANTKMTAETGVMVVEFEKDRTNTQSQTETNKSTYKIENVDLGLEERPKAGLAIDKEVTNVKLVLADGSTLFDATSTASNVLWKDHKGYNVGYKGNVMDPSKFGNITNIRNENASKFGLIQLSMDEELMHGATIKVTYKITVSNVGEVDYKDNKFYYTGNVGNTNNVVKTSANQVIDYVANNLQFYEADNADWKVISKDDLLAQGLVNTSLKGQVEKYNTIIVTDKLGAQLVPSLYKDKLKQGTDSVSTQLVLTQLITSENETDDLTYKNIVEIVKTSNSVGRKNEYSVVGNQNPTQEPQELDSDRAEVVRILPPFGNGGLYIIIAVVTIVSAMLIAGGIIFIKKKVLRQK